MTMLSRSTALFVAAVLVLLASGCQKEAKADPEAAKAAIKADEKTWNAEFKARNSEGLMAHYADDAFFVAPGVKGTDGSTAIRQVYANASTDPAFAVSFASDKIDVSNSGDMAYARGHFSEKYTDPKTRKVMTDSGSYLTVYKKQPDGSWKASEDFAAADPDTTKEVLPEKPAVRARMTSF